MNFAKGSLRRMGLASAAVGAFVCAWPAARPASAQSLNLPGLDGFANSVGGAITGLWSKKSDDGSGGTIDYRPRPALVVPPNYDLPAPQPNSRRAVNWPKDPDAAALRRARQDSRRPAPTADSRRSDGDDAGQDDTAAAAPATGPASAVAANQNGTPMNCSNVSGTPVCVSSLFSKFDLPSIPGLDMIPGLGKKDKDDSAAETVRLNPNPSRKYLTDPPVDYLEAVQVPQKGEKSASSGDGGKQAIERAPPAVDRTPPGK